MIVAIIICSCIICLLLLRNHNQHMDKLDELQDRDDGFDPDALPAFDDSPKGKRRRAKGTKKLMEDLRPGIDAHRAAKGLPPVDWDKATARADKAIADAEKKKTD